MNTIKPRHLKKALDAMGHTAPSEEAIEALTPAEPTEMQLEMPWKEERVH